MSMCTCVYVCCVFAYVCEMCANSKKRNIHAPVAAATAVLSVIDAVDVTCDAVELNELIVV